MSREANRKSQKLFPFVKVAGIDRSVPLHLNPISGDELNKPMASVQILLLLYTIYNMYITCMLLK